MKVKDIITYLLNFNMGAEVVFIDQDNRSHRVTNDPHIYLGNGKVDTKAKEVKFLSIENIKPKTIRDFKIGDYVKVVNETSDLYGHVGVVNAISDRDGGTLMFAQPDTVLVMFKENGKSFGEQLSIHSILKITEKEYRQLLNETHRVYFISGHRDITQDEFDWYYLPILDKLCDDPNCTFVVGDYYGVDAMAQEVLSEMVDPSRVTVYHMFEKPRNLANDKFNLKGGYQTDDERDAAMTHDSTDDIAWIRKGKEKSGTAQNILRRYTFEKK